MYRSAESVREDPALVAPQVGGLRSLDGLLGAVTLNGNSELCGYAYRPSAGAGLHVRRHDAATVPLWAMRSVPSPTGFRSGAAVLPDEQLDRAANG